MDLSILPPQRTALAALQKKSRDKIAKRSSTSTTSSYNELRIVSAALGLCLGVCTNLTGAAPMSIATQPDPHTRPAHQSLGYSVSHSLAPLARVLDHFQGLFALGTRLYVSWVFLKSGWLKISDWEQTLSLFQDEYRVPLLPPALAAVAGTFGELFFPILLILGLAGRLGAVGLFAVNAMAVISYAHVLYQEGFEAAIGQHYLWGFMLLMLAFYGPGSISADRLLAGRYKATQPV